MRDVTISLKQCAAATECVLLNGSRWFLSMQIKVCFTGFEGLLYQPNLDYKRISYEPGWKFTKLLQENLNDFYKF
jgi:hypothetical protein